MQTCKFYEELGELLQDPAKTRRVMELLGRHQMCGDCPLGHKAPRGRPRQPLPDEFAAIYNDYRSGKITARYAQQQLQVNQYKFYRMIKKYQSEESAAN